MDKRSIFTTLAFTLVLMGVILLQRYANEKYFKPAPAIPTPPASTAGPTPGPGPATSQTVVTAGWQIAPAPTSGPVSLPVSLGSAVPDAPDYALQLNAVSRGAALSSVVLNQFKAAEDFRKPVKQRRLYSFQTPAVNVDSSEADALATRRVEINGAAVNLFDADWALEPSFSVPAAPGASLSATYSVTLNNNGAPGLKIFKTYTVYPIKSPQGGNGFEVRLEYKLQNLSGGPLSVKLISNGPTMPPKEGGRGADRQVVGGYRDGAEIDVAQHPVEEFKKDKQETLDVTRTDKGPMAWIGSCSVYFDGLMLPLKDDPNIQGNAAVGDYIENVTAKGWDFGDADLPAEDRPVTLTLQTTAQTLAPDRTVTLPIDVYFGPKWRAVFNDAHYASSPRHYDESLVVKSGWCAICTSEKLIEVMVWLLTGFHWIAGGFAGHGDWGIAIILLVGVVRFLLHPITKKSQVQMMKMGKMGPEMERLKKKYADDKDELNRQMMQIYKAQGATPILGCLPMFLQMPIWIALYSCLQSTFELRQSPFLWNWTWIHDLSKPDYLVPFGRSIPLLFGFHIDGINLLPVLLGVVFFVQQKYMTPPNPAATPEQLQQQKMMQWMTPFIFPLMLYNSPSGLNLYIFASTLFGNIESRIIRKHIKEREEAEKAERVIVDAKPTRQGKILSRTDTTDVAPAGGLRGFWANLQAKAEEARREQDRKGKGGGRK